MNVFVRDPAAAPVEAYEEYDILLKIWKDLPSADAIVVAVAYQNFLSLPLSDFSEIAKKWLVLSILSRSSMLHMGVLVWRL